MGHVSAPKFDTGVVAAAGDQLGVDQVEVDAPAALLVLLPHRALRVRRRVPDDHRALVVAAGQRALVEAAPRDAGDLARTDHLCGGIVNIDHVLQDHIIVIDLDFLSHAGDCKKLLVLVKFNTGDNGAVVEHVRGVGQGRQRPHAVVPDNKSSLLIFADVNLSNANRIPFKICAVQCGMKKLKVTF